MILQSHPSDTHAWVLLSAPGCLLALPSAEATRLDGIVARLAGEDGFRAALELLIADGIAGAPSFALLDGDSSIARVVLRGEATVTVTTSDPDAGELTISGAGVSTWSERVLEGARSLRLQLPGSTWTVHLDAAAPAFAPSADEPAEEAPGVSEVGEATLAPSSQIEVPSPSPTAAADVTAPPTAAPAAPAPEPAPVADAFAYDFLFGDTIYRTQAGISVRIPNPDPERPGDHDGRTMLAEELGLRGRVPAEPVFPELPSASVTEPATTTESTVVAPIPGHVPAARLAEPSRPQTGSVVPALQLERADGVRESLGRPVLIGRAPTATGAAASGPAPRLITIADDKDISRNHVRIAVEGDAVIVTDLASKNGTVITLPGGSPRKLRGGEPAVVLPDTLIDLGGGVTFTVRED